MKVLNVSRMSLRDHEVAKQSSTLSGEIATSSFDKLRTPRNDGECAFTLVEILVVIAIVAIVGTLLVAIFIATLRGSNKAQILSVIKQNGQSVLENLDKTIRSADKVICPVSSGSPSPILVLEKNSVYTRFIFIAGTGSANGKIMQDSPQRPIPPAPFDCTDQILVNPVTLIDTNTQSGVSVSSTNAPFTRNISTGFRDQVTVVFDLKPGVAAPAAVAGQIDPVTFQTTVQLRND